MTEQEMQEEIVRVLDKGNNSERYYVYALINATDNKVFYIGKGQGPRIWQHEQDAEKEKIAIINSNMENEEKISQLENVCAKHQFINKIGKENVKKIIIKWGLTEKEAFAAESALINLYNYPKKQLTNIQNGHASKKEKEVRGITKAYSVEDFYRELALAPIQYDMLKYSYTNKKIIFINIAKEYEQFMNPEQIMNTARGRWKVDSDKKPEFLFAVSRSVIVGVFKITEIHGGLETSGFPDNTEIRQMEKKLIEEIKDTVNEEICYENLTSKLQKTIDHYYNSGIIFKKDCKIEEAFDKWYDRSYFICDSILDKDITFGNLRYDDLINHRIIKNYKEDGERSLFYGLQNPIKYNDF